MKRLLARIDVLHVLAFVLLWAPVPLLLLFGAIWLWQSGHTWQWLALMAAVSVVGWLLRQWLVKRGQAMLAAGDVPPDPSWPASADQAWQDVDEFAAALKVEDWPFDDGNGLLRLGRATLEKVAHRLNPDVEQPLLEITLPHTLLILERASRDLRIDIAEHIPFSHRLRLADITRVRRLKDIGETAFNVYRAGRVVVNPVSALFAEMRGYLADKGMMLAGGDMQRWLLANFVRRVGRYAIDLYSGRLPLADATPDLTRAIDDAGQQADATSASVSEEPLRIVLVGRATAGKSSLINALFGEMKAATDALPSGAQAVAAYRLDREGRLAALVFDTPALDGPAMADAVWLKLFEDADLVLWLLPVNRPDRALERNLLDRMRSHFIQHRQLRQPPLLFVATHIDRLRPLNEWQPPYDVANPVSAKEKNIRAALDAIAADLGIGIGDIVPVSLAPGQTYNVDEELWSVMLARQDAMQARRFARCLGARRSEEQWGLVMKQLKNSGRVLWQKGKNWLDEY